MQSPWPDLSPIQREVAKANSEAQREPLLSGEKAKSYQQQCCYGRRLLGRATGYKVLEKIENANRQTDLKTKARLMDDIVKLCWDMCHKWEKCPAMTGCPARKAIVDTMDAIWAGTKLESFWRQCSDRQRLVEGW